MKQGHNEAYISGEVGHLEIEQHETQGGLLLENENDVRRLLEYISHGVPFFDVATKKQLKELHDMDRRGQVLSEDYRQSNAYEIAQCALSVRADKLAKERHVSAWGLDYSDKITDALEELNTTGRFSIEDSLPFAPGLNVWKTGDSEHPFAGELVRSYGFDASNTIEKKVAEELGFARGVAAIDVRANVLGEPRVYDVATLLNKLSYPDLAPVAQVQSGCLGPLGKLMHRGSDGVYKPEDIAASLVSDAKINTSLGSLHLGVKDGFVISLKLLRGREAVSNGTIVNFSEREPETGFVITIQGYKKLGKDSWSISPLLAQEQLEAARQLAESITKSLSE